MQTSVNTFCVHIRIRMSRIETEAIQPSLMSQLVRLFLTFGTDVGLPGTLRLVAISP